MRVDEEDRARLARLDIQRNKATPLFVGHGKVYRPFEFVLFPCGRKVRPAFITFIFIF